MSTWVWVRRAALLLVTILLATGWFGGSKDELTIVWYPNESGEDKRETRQEIERVIYEATGKDVRSMLTTDYTIAIEALANNKAHLSYIGAQGYVEANRKNPEIQPVAVYTGKSGTLQDAVYYGWLAVRSANASQYADGQGRYTIDNLQGKRFSFVSVGSTSGFKVPSVVISGHFAQKPAWPGLTPEDLVEGGSKKLFSAVLFGGTHIGAAVNLLTDKADAASLASSQLLSQLDLVSGNVNMPGSVYKVKADAKDPLNRFAGEGLTLIGSTPVLNEPFVANTGLLSKEEVVAIQRALTSDAVADNPLIFVPKGSSTKGIFTKNGDNRFVQVTDAWFQPIRDLSK